MSRSRPSRRPFDPQGYSSECRGKIRYTSKKLAKGALRVMTARGRGGARLHEYCCSVCRGWHLGNSREGAA